MKVLKTTPKIFSYIAILSGSLWIGAYLTRLFVTYQIFEGPDLIFKAFVNQANLGGILLMLLPAITTTFTLYIIFILSFALFIISSKIKFRENGWLFIMSVVILICLPFEAFLMTIDYQLILSLNSGTFLNQNIIDLIVKRFKILGSFPLIEIFCYMSFYYFILFKPFNKRVQINNED